jgi:hypothetical protein
MNYLYRRFFSTTPPLNMAAAQQKAQKLIDENAVGMLSRCRSSAELP